MVEIYIYTHIYIYILHYMTHVQMIGDEKDLWWAHSDDKSAWPYREHSLAHAKGSQPDAKSRHEILLKSSREAATPSLHIALLATVTETFESGNDLRRLGYN